MAELNLCSSTVGGIHADWRIFAAHWPYRPRSRRSPTGRQPSRTAQACEGDTEATVGRLTGTDDRVVLCALDRRVHAAAVLPLDADARTATACCHVAHTEPNDYDGAPLADILTAERAWVDGT